MSLGLVTSQGANFNNLRSLLSQSRQRTSQYRQNNAQAAAAAAAGNAAGGAAVGAGQGAMSQGQQMQMWGATQQGGGNALIQLAMGAMQLGWVSPTPGVTNVADVLFAIGTAMVITGTATSATGALQVADGNAQVNDGKAILADAVDDGILAADEAAAASFEIQRSNQLEQEISALEQIMNKVDEDNPNMSAQERSQLEQGFKDGMKEGFERAAKTIHNRGIYEDDDGRYFIREDDGDFMEVDVEREADGSVKYDEYGRVTQSGIVGGISSNDPKAKELFGAFVFYDTSLDMMTGDGQNPALTRFEFTQGGSVIQRDYDPSNPVDTFEYMQIVNAAHENPPPLRYFETADGKLAFEEYDWENGQSQGSPIYLEDLVSPVDDVRNAALQATGFSGGPRFDLLDPIIQNSKAGDESFDPNQYANRVNSAGNQASGGNSGSGGSANNNQNNNSPLNNQQNQANQGSGSNGLGSI